MSFLVKVIQSFLSDRSFQIRADKDLSEIRSSAAGVPQGHMLISLLFKFWSLEVPSHQRVINASYGDDIALIKLDGVISSVETPHN